MSLHLIICLAPFIGSTFSSIFREEPSNVAGKIGDHVTLKCQGSDPSAVLSWVEFVTNQSIPNRIATLTNTYASFRDKYTVSMDEDRTYYLTILLDATTAGLYACEQLAPVHSSSYASVISIDQSLTCRTSISSYLIQGDIFNFYCFASFSGDPSFAPRIVWTDATGIISAVSSRVRNGVVEASFAKTATPEVDGMIYNANLHFVHYGGVLGENHSAKVPAHSETWSSSPVTVYYLSRNVHFEPDGSVFFPGAEIECLADAKPTHLDHTWVNLLDNSTFQGNILFVSERMLDSKQKWRCSIVNTIGRRELNSSAIIEFTVTAYATDAVHSVWFYATVGLSVVALVAVIVACAFVCRRRPLRHETPEFLDDHFNGAGCSSMHVYNDVPKNPKGVVCELKTEDARQAESWFSIDSYADMEVSQSNIYAEPGPPPTVNPHGPADYENLDALRRKADSQSSVKL